MAVTEHVIINSTRRDIASLVPGRKAQLANRIRPTSFGVTSITATLGPMMAAQDVVIQGLTSIATLRTVYAATFDDIDPSDPSSALCNATFRGPVGTLDQLIGTFVYTDNDSLNCSVTMPLGNLPTSGMLTDVLTLSSQIISMQTTDAAIAIDVQQSADNKWYNLLLQSSASGMVTVTATGGCTANGLPTLLSNVQMFANLEADQFQLDFGHRCGAPIGRIEGSQQSPLSTGATVWVPIYMHSSAQAALQSFTGMWQYQLGTLQILDVVKPGSTNTIAGYDCFKYSDKVALAYSIADDRVKLNIVWPEEPLPLCALTTGPRYSVIAVLHLQV
jgi:hypothetical protein